MKHKGRNIQCKRESAAKKSPKPYKEDTEDCKLGSVEVRVKMNLDHADISVACC